MNVEAKRFINKLDYLEKKLIGEDKKIFVEAMFLFDECARMLNEKELQVVKQKKIIDKAVEYTTKEKNNYLHHVQKAIGECIDDKGNINSNTAGLLISAAVNTCDCILDVLNGISK